MSSITTELTIPSLDELYVALRVGEIWRFDGDTAQVIIERPPSDGQYQHVDESRFLPVLAEEIRRWVVEEDSDDEAAWA